MTKNERNEAIVSMYNNGKTERQISDEMKLSKTAVHAVISKHIEPTSTTTTTKGVSFTSFVGWLRTAKNVYSNKETGETVNIKFVKGVNGSCGTFVTT